MLSVAKTEVEEAWDWQALRTTATITGVASQSVYTCDTGGESDVDIRSDARLLYMRTSSEHEVARKVHDSVPQVFDVTDADEFRLTEVTPERMEMLHLTDADETIERPGTFTIYRDADDMFFRVHPTPTGVRTWKIRFLNPQADLDEDDLTTVLSVPAASVWLRALLYANQERGEEQGAPGSTLSRQVSEALHGAIAKERTEEDDTSYPR
jgi:hypothetical protein